MLSAVHCNTNVMQCNIHVPRLSFTNNGVSTGCLNKELISAVKYGGRGKTFKPASQQAI
jgi:hypothetical protein